MTVARHIAGPRYRGRARAPAPTTRWFRHDVEGMRAVAVILVVLYHAGVPGITGGFVGVDVFFVISGFLITGLLTRELAARGTISIGTFYARRAVRLLPAATVVLTTVLVASWLWVPALRFRAIAADTLAATVYTVNYRLAADGTDYLQATQAPSPVRHFWSLAVEEQFYLVWPVVVLAVGALAARRQPAALRTVLAVVFAGSLALSVWQTDLAAPWAYFGTHTRAWELATGAGLAVTAGTWSRLSPRTARALRWLGLAAVLAAAVGFDEATAFPGYAALLPVAGTAAVIAAGCAHPSRALRPLLIQGIGCVSYSWYLWHWPVLLIAPYALGFEPGLNGRIGLVGAALLLAILTYRWVEDPVRTAYATGGLRWGWQPRPLHITGFASAATAGLAALALIAPPALTGGGPVGTGSAAAAAAVDAAPATESGLLNLVAASADTRAVPAGLTPTLAGALTEQPVYHAHGCDPDFATSDLKTPCAYGDLTSPVTVVLFGDSHAGHWFSALDRIATERRWRLVVMTKSACSAASVLIVLPALKREYRECVQWRAKALDRIRELRPALVVMASNGGGGMPVGGTGDADRVWTDAWLTSIRAIKTGTARPVLISDTPWPIGDVPECVSEHLTDVRPCGNSTDGAVVEPTRRRMVADAAAREGATVIDPVSWFCAAGKCPVIVGNVLVYRDDSHLTGAYSALLGPLLAAKLPEVGRTAR